MGINQRSIKRISFLILLISLCACSINEKDNEEDSVRYFSGMNYPNFEEPNTGLGRAVNFRDTLVITVEFSDCGEWGGRREMIILSRDESRLINANFKMDTVCCDTKIITAKGTAVLDDDTRVNKIDITKILTLEDEKLINVFIHRILELSLNLDRYPWYYEPIQDDVIKDIEEIEEDIVLVRFLNDDVGSRIEIKSTSSNLYIAFNNYHHNVNTWYGRVRKQLFGELIIGN